MNLLSSLLAVLFLGSFVLAIYLAIIRPAFIFWLRRQAVAVRDDLQLAVLTGAIGDHEKSMRFTMQKLNILIRGCEHTGLTAVFLANRTNASLHFEAEREVQIDRDAGSVMKDLIRRGDMLIVGSMVANSPFFWFVLPPLFALGTLTGKIARWINYVSRVGTDRSEASDHEDEAGPSRGGFAHA